MKRYIEIVYDNSGSMKERVGNKLKYEIAQELFEKDILPSIGLRGDEVILRLLRNGCKYGTSIAEPLPNQRNVMLQRIKGINHNQGTPLFYTILDSVEACRKVKADQYLIFVLTDGDDTCQVKIEDLIDKDTLKKYVQFCNVKVKSLMVQLAVDSPVSRNNLTAFTNSLGGQAISLDSSDSIPQMRKKLKLALNVSGFTNKFPLEHCFNELQGFDLAWEEIEESGINFHQAMLLHQKGLLTWMPNFDLVVSTLQFAELHFLFSLLFKSGLPEDLLKTMLSQLKKPYFYSFDCIYWDFAFARWKYLPQQNKVEQLPNPTARFEDEPERNAMLSFDNPNTHYSDNVTYRVEIAPKDIISFQLVQDNFMKLDNKLTSKILKDGDRVIFKWK
jgi:hypothetical protein